MVRVTFPLSSLSHVSELSSVSKPNEQASTFPDLICSYTSLAYEVFGIVALKYSPLSSVFNSSVPAFTLAKTWL